MAEQFGRVATECGASRYREFVGDDLDGFEKSETGLNLVAAVVEFASRSERDSVMAAVMDDERVKGMMDAESLADMRGVCDDRRPHLSQAAHIRLRKPKSDCRRVVSSVR